MYVCICFFFVRNKISHFAYHYETFTNKKNKTKKNNNLFKFQIQNHPIEMSENLVDVVSFDIDQVLIYATFQSIVQVI